MVSINDMLPPAKSQSLPIPRPLLQHAPRTMATRRQEQDLSRPNLEDREAQLQQTQNALDALIAAKTGAGETGPSVQSIEYKTAGEDRSHNLRIVEQQHDPLEPPRHRYKKEHEVTPVTGETAAPLLRPEAKLSAEEKQQWAVPASISNWKNPRGYVINLEKRAAADKAMARSTSAKHSDLADALSTAGAELQAEQETKRLQEEQEASQIQQQQRLKLKLLAQKSESAKRDASTQDKDDLFDSRLFHKSKRRHNLYDEPLFAAAQETRRAFRPAGQQQDVGNLKPVEFEEHE